MKTKRPYREDPEPHEETEEYKLEMFETFRCMGWTPDDIRTDPKWRADYEEWLKTHPPE